MTGTPCDDSRGGAAGAATLIVLYLAPAIIVAYGAIVASKSRLSIIGLSTGAAVLTFLAVSIAALFWAGAHSCLG